MDSFQDDPQYKGMKYLVFGTILSSLLSELHIIIPKADRSGLSASHRWEVLRTARSCASAPPPLLPQAAASRVASLLLACPPPRPCPEARLHAPHRSPPRTCELTEIEWVWIPVHPSAPPRHPAPASMSVGRRRARGFPPGQSPSPLVGAVPRPTLGSRLSA